MPGPKYVKDFEFPSSAGFTGSATDRTTVPVRSYERRRPVRMAEGGKTESERPPMRYVARAFREMKPGEPTTLGDLRERAEEMARRAKKEESLVSQRKAHGGAIRKGHMARSTPHQSAYETSPHPHKAGGGPVKARRGGKIKP